MSPSVCPWAIVMVGIMEEDCGANVVYCICQYCNCSWPSSRMSRYAMLCHADEGRVLKKRERQKEVGDLMPLV